MDAKCNTPKVLCLGLLLIAVLTAAISLVVGCETLNREATRREIAAALQIAYDAGGKEAVSNRIEQLVAEGKISRAQGDAIHAWAQVAYATVVDELNGGEAVTNACDACTIECGDGDCNEDAFCGECEDCKAQ